MKIDVNKVFGTSDEYIYEGELKKELFDIEKGDVLEDVKVKLNLHRIGREIFVKGNFQAKVKQICVRCLNEFQEVIFDEFELIYLPESIYKTYEESLKNDHEYSINEVLREKLENGFIDVKKIIEEYIIVAMPDFPKCSQECEGIKEIEEYNDNEIDHRWEQLLNIVKEK